MPAEVIAPHLLALAWGVLGRNASVTIKAGSWTEFPILWSCLVAQAGSAKTPALTSRPDHGLRAKLIGGRYLTVAGARYADIYVVGRAPTNNLYVVERATKAMVASVLGPGCDLAREELRHSGFKPGSVGAEG